MQVILTHEFDFDKKLPPESILMPINKEFLRVHKGDTVTIIDRDPHNPKIVFKLEDIKGDELVITLEKFLGRPVLNQSPILLGE